MHEPHLLRSYHCRTLAAPSGVSLAGTTDTAWLYLIFRVEDGRAWAEGSRPVRGARSRRSIKLCSAPLGPQHHAAFKIRANPPPGHAGGVRCVMSGLFGGLYARIRKTSTSGLPGPRRGARNHHHRSGLQLAYPPAISHHAFVLPPTGVRRVNSGLVR
jgi:hypothetical protein